MYTYIVIPSPAAVTPNGMRAFFDSGGSPDKHLWTPSGVSCAPRAAGCGLQPFKQPQLH